MDPIIGGLARQVPAFGAIDHIYQLFISVTGEEDHLPPGVPRYLPACTRRKRRKSALVDLEREPAPDLRFFDISSSVMRMPTSHWLRHVAAAHIDPASRDVSYPAARFAEDECCRGALSDTLRLHHIVAADSPQPCSVAALAPTGPSQQHHAQFHKDTMIFIGAAATVAATARRLLRRRRRTTRNPPPRLRNPKERKPCAL